MAKCREPGGLLSTESTESIDEAEWSGEDDSSSEFRKCLFIIGLLLNERRRFGCDGSANETQENTSISWHKMEFSFERYRQKNENLQRIYSIRNQESTTALLALVNYEVWVQPKWNNTCIQFLTTRIEHTFLNSSNRSIAADRWSGSRESILWIWRGKERIPRRWSGLWFTADKVLALWLGIVLVMPVEDHAGWRPWFGRYSIFRKHACRHSIRTEHIPKTWKTMISPTTITFVLLPDIRFHVVSIVSQRFWAHVKWRADKCRSFVQCVHHQARDTEIS